MIAFRPAALALAAAALAAAPAARAQFWRAPEHAGTPPDVAPVTLEDVRVDERLGAQVPLDLGLVDGEGRPFRLGSLFGQGKPVVLALVYYDCPMLCGLIQSGMARAMRENGLLLGKDFQAVSVSFDPSEKPALGAERRRGYLQSLGIEDKVSADWPFLVGSGEATRALADSVGFHYKYDEVSGEWAHVAAILVLTPEGKVSRYLYGVEYPPKDFRLSLVEAASGKVGTSFDRFLLTCYRYDPASRKYEPYAWGFVRLGGLAVLLALSGLIARLVWRERKARHAT
ncbi:MAG TPA: SCO family protein [Anaeromyxobacteraceae bacterium]|nr:SCO family protein [Anaeromyxobacteraceae bacterium]